MEQRFDAIVVGGGVIGASAAYYLAKTGLKVCLLEKENVASQTSAESAALLEGQFKANRPGPFLDLCVRGRELFPQVSAELLETSGMDIEWERCGLLSVAEEEHQHTDLRYTYEWQKQSGFPVDWWEPEDIRKNLPGLEPPVTGGLFYPQEAQIHSGKRLTQAFAEGARKRRAQIRENAPVAKLLGQNRKIQGVVLENGDRYFAESVVLAAGCWTGPIAKSLGVEISIEPVRGQIFFFRGERSYLPVPVFCKDQYLVAKKDGRILLGSTYERAGFHPHPTLEAMAYLTQFAVRFFPSFAELPFERGWAGLRPAASDELPILGPVPEWEGLTIAAGHYRNGMVLAPLTGQRIAELLTGKKPTADIDAFSPKRFIGAAT